MTSLDRIVAAHPLRDYLPYNALKFVRVDNYGTPLYRVAKSRKELGPREALRLAVRTLGGHCFHCEEWMPAERAAEGTVDHLRPSCEGGTNYLHNLVFSCVACNRKKGRTDLVTFQAESGSKYLKAMDEHIARCLRGLSGK